MTDQCVKAKEHVDEREAFPKVLRTAFRHKAI